MMPGPRLLGPPLLGDLGLADGDDGLVGLVLDAEKPAVSPAATP
jgi:hypothetical protein